MPGLLDRVSMLVRANLNDLIDRSEDPEKMIKQAIIDMNNQMIQVRTQVAASIADEQKLYTRYMENQERSTEWQRKAELAVTKDEDDLAREALTRRNSYQQIADGFKTQYDEQQKQVELLKSALDKLRAKIEEAERKKDLLLARSRSARAQQAINDTLSGIGKNRAFESFDRMEEKVADQEARAKAAEQLSHDSLEDRFAALEAGSAADDDLNKLKQQMGRLEAPKPVAALGTGDDDLAALKQQLGAPTHETPTEGEGHR